MTQDFSTTGRPVFILATTEDMPCEPFELRDASRLADLIPTDAHLVDRLMHSSVKGFFHLGGQTLTVLPIHIDGSVEDLNAEYLNRVLGDDSGYLRRTGYHALKNFDHVTDLVVFPQAPILLGAHELAFFYRDILRTLEKFLPTFLLIDTPCYSSPRKALEWASQLHSPVGAAFYPWIAVREVGFLPVSILAAAFLQNLDARQGLAEPPANRQLPSGFQPLAHLTPAEVRQLTSAHLNCIRELSDDSYSFWGTNTLNREGNHLDQVHVVRSLRQLQDAIERTCEPFLMEARTTNTCRKMEYAVTALLENACHLHILAASAEGERSFHVDCHLESGKLGGREPTIQLCADIALESPDRRIGLSVNL